MKKAVLSIGLVFAGCVVLALALGSSAKACGICEQGTCLGSTVPPDLWQDPVAASAYCEAKSCDGNYCACDCRVSADWQSCYCG